MHLLSVRSLHKSFGAHQAVSDVSFQVKAGELVALIGPNGAGKTTTFNMINGQLPATDGRVILNGRDILGLPPRRITRLGVARTFQVAAVFGSLTVLENIQLALLAYHRRVFRFLSRVSGQYQALALDLLGQVGMDDQAHRPCSELAYGDVKRVELAMALASQPELLLMDEPTAGMAPAERRELMTLVEQLARRHNMGVLFTEHSMDVVFAHADRVIVLARGRIVAMDSPEAIRANPDVQRVYFGTADQGEPVRKPAAYKSAAQQPLLTVSSLNAWYGAAHTLFDVSLSLRQGEVLALMGRNGAGKSTTLKSIMGLLKHRTGDIQFMGQAIHRLPAFQIARLGLGYVPEDRRIFTDLTVIENLRAGQQPPRRWPDGSTAPSWSLSMMFDYFPNLAERATSYGNQMSGGEQQMLAVARTLMGNPYVVLLDEPSEGVAPVIVEAMVRMIRLLKQRGVSVILSEQNVGFAALVADRVYVLEKGQICYEGDMAEFARDGPARQRLLAV